MEAKSTLNQQRQATGGIDLSENLTALEAAEWLRISPRKLWDMTKSKTTPHVQLGRRALYPKKLLQQWVDARTVGAPPLSTDK